MKKYVFRLETVRRVRRVQEELAKADLLHANSDVQRAIAAVEARTEEYERSRDSVTFGVAGVDSFMRQRYFNELSGKAVIAARSSQAAAEVEAAAMRQLYIEAARKVKALDRLDERRREEYQVEFNRDTDREVDDIVTGRFGRVSTGGAG